VERRARRAEAAADLAEKGRLEEEAAGQNGQSRRLVQDEDIGVFEKNAEVRRRVGLVPRRAMIDEEIAGGETVIG
jgi:hypothetical protein